MDGIFWQSCMAAKLGESCSPDAAEGEPSGKFIPSSSKAVCCLSFNPVSLGVGPDRRPIPWDKPDSSSPESELISMIGSCSWEPCSGFRSSGVGGGEYLTSPGSKYSMDNPSSFTSSASDSRSTLGKFRTNLIQNPTCSILMMGMEKGVRKLLMTSSTSEPRPKTSSLFSSFGLTSDRTATFLTNFPKDESKPRSVATSLTQSLEKEHIEQKMAEIAAL